MLDFDEVDDDALAACLERKTREKPPVLVCFYSGGMTPEQGRELLREWLAAAAGAGVGDAVVLDHPAVGGEHYACCGDLSSYCSRLVEVIDEAPERRGRSLVLFGHSYGCVRALGLAARLGPRVRKMYLVACRAPTMAPFLLDELWGVDSCASVSGLGDEALFEGLVEAYAHPLFARYRETRPLPPFVVESMAVVRRMYSSPCSPSGSADLDAAWAAYRREPPSAPILAVAASGELPRGETAAKMEGWRELTSGAFELITVDEDHMACKACIGPVLEDMRQFYE
mmetsp:Transcript_29042/g.81951  ORF Transcript_29042/g.81951 Transcript_29042/m.81951 type:complete len:284 (-) Transcript_29042:30-881(-)